MHKFYQLLLLLLFLFLLLGRIPHRSTTPWVKKGCHPNHGYNFVNSRSLFKIHSLLQRALNF